MKLRWRYGIAFPLILSVALGGLAAWLGRISEIQTEEVRLNPNEPQYSMKGINGKRFDEAGRLKENLSSSKAWQMPGSNDVHFSSPQLIFRKEGRLLYQVRSDEAVYKTENKQVVFDNNVILTKEADAEHPAGVFKTSRLHVDTETEFAKTDAPVAYEYGQSHGTANGMTFDNKKSLLNFPSRVKATIYDAKNL